MAETDSSEQRIPAAMCNCGVVVLREYDTRADDATTRTRTIAPIALVSTNTRDATRDETMGAEAVSASN